MQKAVKTGHLALIWQLYQQTVFYWGSSVPAFTEFAIITAYNPNGKILTLNENKKRHKKLISRVIELELDSVPLIGSSPDYIHQEDGLAISMERRSALELAAEYEQNAIYYVSKDQLMLLPCKLAGPEVTQLGSFTSRLVKAPQGHF